MFKHKMWRNGKGGNWSARIVWYQDAEGENFKLKLEDCEIKYTVVCSSKEEADHVWFMFKQGAPLDGQKVPFVVALLQLLGKM